MQSGNISNRLHRFLSSILCVNMILKTYREMEAIQKRCFADAIPTAPEKRFSQHGYKCVSKRCRYYLHPYCYAFVLAQAPMLRESLLLEQLNSIPIQRSLLFPLLMIPFQNPFNPLRRIQIFRNGRIMIQCIDQQSNIFTHIYINVIFTFQ